MPWCDDCSRFFTPTSLDADGSCPACGRRIAEVPGTPWHFKLLLAAVVLYLGFRGYQGVVWVVEQL